MLMCTMYFVSTSCHDLTQLKVVFPEESGFQCQTLGLQMSRGRLKQTI